MSNATSSSGGIGVTGLLGVAFIVLKLCGVITWSWWWVTSPFWGGVALAVLFFLGVLVVTAVQHYGPQGKSGDPQ
jgi:hypothetical protein